MDGEEWESTGLLVMLRIELTGGFVTGCAWVGKLLSQLIDGQN